ncbi:acyltransferase-like protein [Cereibacter ovatus]|uniref:Acyltransferase-like protein n=1 Tax=Cereibacter ovatus TaxID=439529 RepID=A0A285CPJ0_9RHOB|nr:acyltransferase [Cereibacter ovatus]SNX69479.1 acyltransferase-like protein [Cereibacter ovatus]
MRGRLLQRDLPVETARLLATVLLVAYHVIGSTPEAGLQIDYPHPARLFADFFRDLRMPLFAFIAGLVFALKPLGAGDLPRFALGKIRRLVVPGAVAIALSVVAAKIVPAGVPDLRWWEYAVFPILHYWFLMSILVIFLVYAPLDALSRGGAALPAFILATAFGLWGPKPSTDVFSVIGAIYLAPYFLFGVVFCRYAPALARVALPAVLLAALAVVVGSALSIGRYMDLGAFSDDRQDLQSLALGLGGCVVAMLALPRLTLIDRFGAYSFTIYLYHVFATSLTRRVLTQVGVDDPAIQIPLGLMAGLALPVLLHVLAARSPVSAALVLGVRRGAASRGRAREFRRRDA